MDITYSPALKRFVCSVRRLAMNDQNYRRSDNQCIKLIIQLEDALTGGGFQPDWKIFRKPVLQAITGQQLMDVDGYPSQNMLTSRWHSVLIDATLDGQADFIIREIANLVSINFAIPPWKLFPEDW